MKSLCPAIPRRWGGGGGGGGAGGSGYKWLVHYLYTIRSLYGNCIGMLKLVPFSKFMRFPTLFYNVKEGSTF